MENVNSDVRRQQDCRGMLFVVQAWQQEGSEKKTRVQRFVDCHKHGRRKDINSNPKIKQDCMSLQFVTSMTDGMTLFICLRIASAHFENYFMKLVY